MAKKFKPKAITKQEQQNNDPSQSMMTEQEEKMFYANKKMTLQNSHLSHIKKKNTTLNSVTNYENDDDQNIEHFQLSNLNQTSAEEITEFINKLIAKNKVTSKNAFDIPLIHLEQMEDFRSSLNENTWKRLSSTLENDYKIYGYRVDAAHTITYKMVESIARHQAAGQETKVYGINGLNKSTQVGKSKNGPTNSELLNSFMETSFNNENISRNKMNVDYTKFIQKNQKLINVTHIESFFGCNPGLEKTKRKFDQQGLKALLLNNIALRNGCELKLDQHRRHNLEGQNDRIKKENFDNSSSQIQTQQNDDLNQFQSMHEKMFNPAIPENKIQFENQQPQQSIFDLIYQLNINECKSNQDQYKKFEKLYKIISGQDREEKRMLVRKKQIDQKFMIVDQENVEVIQQEVMNCEMDNGLVGHESNANQEGQIVKNNQDTQPKLIEGNDKDNQQNIKADSQPINALSKENVQLVVSENQHIPSIEPKQLSSLLDIIPQTISLGNNLHKQQQKQPISYQPQLQSHPLIDKNFQMHELNLQRMEQSQSSRSQQSNKQLSSVYTGKFKNIQEYIKIKQQKVKHQKKPKILIGDMTSQEIGWKLFNRKYKKKKNQHIKSQHLLKQQYGTQNTKKKVNFSKTSKPSNDLKRSIIFKKSQTQERTFNQIKEKIKKKLQERQKNKQKDEAQNMQKKRKGKKTTKLFDLPIYQFQSGDTNFLEPYEQIDPLTNQLEFSEIYKNHFPSFVQSSCRIIDEIRKKNEQKEKQAQQQAKKKQNEYKEQQNQMIEQNQNLNESGNQNNLRDFERPEDQQNQDQQPDISFIGDEMGQFRSKNQVAIRDAKQKVRKIILQKFCNIKSRKNQSKKQKKISFKQIYEAYYRRQGFISPALCFLTILHLANQHNLVLQGKQDGTDFKIFVEEQNEISQKMKENDFGMQIEPIIEEFHAINRSVSQSIISSTKQEQKAEQDIIQVE